MPEAYVAAGSNVRPRAHLRLALALAGARWHGLRFSRAFQSPAQGLYGPDYVNLVLAFEAGEPPAALKAALRGIEAACGRERGPGHRAGVTLDLDLLLYGDLCGSFDGVTLPDPELLERPYLLGPLADLAPGLRHPRTGERVGDCWARMAPGAAPLVPVDLGGGD